MNTPLGEKSDQRMIGLLYTADQNVPAMTVVAKNDSRRPTFSNGFLNAVDLHLAK